MNRSDFHNLSRVRHREAQSLLAAGFTDGAYYLAGYSVECALKACIAKRTQQNDFPDKKLVNDSHTHNLTELLRLSKLTPLLEADPRLENYWATVRDWSEASRYQRWSATDASRMVEAAENESGGILPWIRLHW